MQWRCWLLGHCCPCGCKPVPNRLGDWTAEHDVAEGGPPHMHWTAALGSRPPMRGHRRALGLDMSLPLRHG